MEALVPAVQDRQGGGAMALVIVSGIGRGIACLKAIRVFETIKVVLKGTVVFGDQGGDLSPVGLGGGAGAQP